jgi:hypothetical protein
MHALDDVDGLHVNLNRITYLDILDARDTKCACPILNKNKVCVISIQAS